MRGAPFFLLIGQTTANVLRIPDGEPSGILAHYRADPGPPWRYEFFHEQTLTTLTREDARDG